MKTNHLLRKLAVVAVFIAMTFVAKAAGPTTFAELQTQFAAAVASGVPTTLNISGPIVVNADYSMVSTGDTITLNMVPYNISVTAGTLTIGNKVKITTAYTSAGAIQAASGGNVVINAGCYIVPTTGNAVQALAGGTVTVNGGYIYSTSTAPVVAAGGNVTINGGRIISAGGQYPAVSAGMAINAIATGGTLTINGGYIATTTTGIARAIVIDYNGICIMNGGEVHSDMGGGRGISINNTNAGGKLYVYGGTISALGGGATGGRAIQADNANAYIWISGSPVINGGTEAIIAQRYAVVVVSGTPTITGVIGTNLQTATPAWSPVLYDARAINITATPTTGYYAAQQTVTVNSGTMSVLKYTGASSGGTGAGVTNPVTVTPTSLVYTTDGTNPVFASTAYTAPVTVAIPTVLNVAPIIEGTVVGCPTTFGYYTIGTLMTSAPTPTTPAAKVISLYSDAYQSADPGTNFFPSWNQPTVVTDIKIGTDNVKKYTNFSYEGTELVKHLNVADMKFMHIDLFSSNLTTFNIGPISANPTKETDAVLTLTPNTWNSFDIPVSTFTGVNMSDIFQIGTSGGSGTQTVYLDNIYFWTDAPADTQAPTAFTVTKGIVASDAVELLLNATDNSGAVFYDITYGTTTVTTSGASGVQKSFTVTSLIGTTDYSFSIVARDRSGNAIATPFVVTATTLTSIPGAPVPTFDAGKVISIFSDTYTSVAGTNFNPGWGQATLESAVLLNGNNTIKYANLNYQGIALATFVNASTMNKLHVDIYPIDETSLKITPISPASPNNKEFSVALTPLVLNQWNSYDLPLTGFTGVDMSNVIQFKFTGSTPGTGGKTVYMDNLYFLNDVGVGVNEVAINSVRCYPSQVTDRLTVKAETEISQVVVRNLLGQSVKSIAVNSNEQSIDLSAVSAGNYFITVKLANGQSATQKIVKL
jgi:hypothetical protein